MSKLSNAKLRGMVGKATPTKKAEQFSDGYGLSVERSPKGKLTWLYRYRYDGKALRVKLGSFLARDKNMEPEGHVGLGEARAKREQCRVWLDEGRDPRIELRLCKDARIKEATVEDALRYWYENYAVGHRTNHQKHLAQLEKWVFPYIGRLPLARTETRHWLPVFDAIAVQAPVAAGYVLQMCKQALKYCDVRQYVSNYSLINLTVDDIGRHAQARDRVLTDAELGDLWHSFETGFHENYYLHLLRLVLVFGCRTQEIRLSSWSEWDMEQSIWTVKENSKSGNRIVRPIPERVLPWLEELKTLYRGSPYLLGELRQGPAVSQYGRTLWRRFGHGEQWSTHDLRRTVNTKLNDLGIPPYVAEKLAGHTMAGVMRVYNRAQYLQEQEQALNLWLDKLACVACKSE